MSAPRQRNGQRLSAAAVIAYPVRVGIGIVRTARVYARHVTNLGLRGFKISEQFRITAAGDVHGNGLSYTERRRRHIHESFEFRQIGNIIIAFVIAVNEIRIGKDVILSVGRIDNERVLCVGKKEGRDLYACYNVGQMFVLPSYYERFGAVVNEALLAGCYTLCSSVAGAACLIEPGKNGDIFDPHRLDELVEKLDSALAKCVPLEEIKVKENRMERGYE